jgi:RimJ/RimL family protein N-acetyltransferase
MVELRDYKPQDIELLVKHLNCERVTRYLTTRIPQPYTFNDAEWWINIGSKIGIVKAIDVRSQLVGTIGATPGEFESQRSAEIGYWVAEEYWGKGIATEAINKIVNHIFQNTEIVRLYAPVFSPNKASVRVLEKCGFKIEGVHQKAIYKNGVFFNELIYARVHS